MSAHDRRDPLNFTFMALLGLAALFVWTVGSFFFWRISREHRSASGTGEVQPALRLAYQWLGEAQQRMEELIRTLRVGHVFCLLHTGDQPDDKTRHNSKLFAEEVMPAFTNRITETVAVD